MWTNPAILDQFECWWADVYRNEEFSAALWSSLRDSDTACDRLKKELNKAFHAGWKQAQGMVEDLVEFKKWWKEQNHRVFDPNYYSPSIHKDVLFQIAFIAWKGGRESKKDTPG